MPNSTDDVARIVDGIFFNIPKRLSNVHVYFHEAIYMTQDILTKLSHLIGLILRSYAKAHVPNING